MITVGCQERFELLRHHFAWLYDEYHFSLVFNEGDSSLHCRFILQSNDCRFRIDFDRGGFRIDLAMVPLSPGAVTNIPGLKWYSIEEVLDYLQQGSQDGSKVEDEFRLTGLSLDKKLTLVATEYHPLWPQVIRLFSETEFEHSQEDLERFCQKRNEERERQHAEWLQNTS